MVHPVSAHKAWRIAFWLLAASLLVAMPLISRDYGQSGDEWLQIEYGRDIWNYFFHGDQQALNYANKSLQYSNQEYYGGFFDFIMEAFHQALPDVPLLTLRHFFNAITGALMMIYTGLFSWRVSRKNWMVALLALLFIAFSPRIFGESMNNPKDIPLGCGFIIGIYYWLAFLQDFPRKGLNHAIGIAIGFGFAFGVRSAGGLLQIAYFGVLTLLYWFTNKDFQTAYLADNQKLLKRGLGFLVGAIVIGYIIALLTWPWGLQNPIGNPITSLQEMANRSVTLRVFFEGVFRPNNAQPWYYEFKWICISNPLVVVIGVGLYLISFGNIRKTYGLWVAIFILFAAFFTPLYMVYKKSAVHDTWRHLFFIYPFWVAAATLGWVSLSRLIKQEQLRWIPFAAAVLGLIPAIAWTIKSHPNQYVYFNESVGGLAGAYGYYDTDYYQNTGLQAAQWILKHGRRKPRGKILVASNMLGFGYYFARDTNWLSAYYVRYNDRHRREWDYYITYSRYIPAAQLQNNLWPPANVVHRIEEDGVPLCIIIERKSTEGIPAYEAFEKKDYATAAQAYGKYVQADPTDENAWMNYSIALASIGQLDPAIQAGKKASALDPSNAQAYQLLAQLFQAKGDAQEAQRAINQANSIIIEEQSLNGGE